VSFEFQNLADEELARQTQAGSLAAFEELVYRYEKRIYGFIVFSCPNPADAQELTQDTFVKAFQAIAQFNSGYEFAPWLFTIARRKCVDRHRQAQPPNEELSPELVAADNPAELIARAEERQDLWALVRRLLPTIQFQALWLKYVEEMDLAQIARSLNRSQTHIKVILFRARRALGRALEPNRPSPENRRLRPPLERLRVPATIR
jgi:RNA polymerase sigma-70 factor (ECF subfamily)